MNIFERVHLVYKLTRQERENRRNQGSPSLSEKAKQERVKNIIGSVLFSLTTLFFGTITLQQYLLVASYKEYYPVQTKARIEFVRKNAGSGTLSYQVYTARYFDRSGQPHLLENGPRMNRAYKRGDTLSVRYNPARPDEAIIDDYSQLQGYLKAGLLATVLCAACAGRILWVVYHPQTNLWS